MTFVDSCDRPIRYLRVSVTDRCNLRCVYCMPVEGVPGRTHDEILRYEEIELVVRAAASLGISKVRLTGGEPLVRGGIVHLVSMLARIEGIDDLSMTTNGILLGRYAADLAKAGLRRVNVSLDTLREERFARIARRGTLSDVLAGIESASAAGLEPVKINMVVLRGLNDDEVLDFARQTLSQAWHVRFIELMPLSDEASCFTGSFVSSAQVRGMIVAALGPLSAVSTVHGAGPAAYYRLPDAAGSIGFISAVSEHFCAQCNRLRLTADGRLRPCLLSDREIDLRAALRGGATVAEIRALLKEAILAKPEGHHLGEQEAALARSMSQIGG